MAEVKEKTNEQDTAQNSQQNPQNKKEKKKKEKTKKKGKAGKVIVLMILVILVGFIVSVLGFNAFNLREKYLRTTIDKIPVVKDWLKAPIPKDDTETLSVEQLQAKITSLQREIDNQNTTIDTLTDNNKSLELENTRLREIEAQQVQFKEDKQKFDEMIANNDPNAYSTFYEQISPENAEILYTATKTTAEQQKEVKRYTNTFETIDASAGAKIIEEMVGTDMELATLILQNIDSEQEAKILAAMDPTKAASVVKNMAPEGLNQN